MGRVISIEGVTADPEKISAIQAWPTPSNFKTLCGFLGLTGYYWRFVKQYTHITAPLTDILKQQQFQWSIAAAKSFLELKTAMTSIVTLTLLNFEATFDITTDASNVAIDAVLSQNDRPIAFYSKKMCLTMQASSAYVRELFAITEAVKKWRQYLLGRRFWIFNNKKSLKHLLSQVVQTPEHYKWATKLIGFDFEINYKPDKENRVADALNRINDAQIMALSSIDPTWVTDLRTYYQQEEGKKLAAKLLKTQSTNHFQLHDSLIFCDNKLFIPMAP